MTPATHSFNRPSLLFGEQHSRSSHRRYNSLPVPRRKDTDFPPFAEQSHTGLAELTLHSLSDSNPPALAAPISLRRKLQHWHRPRPNTVFCSASPQIVLGEPKEHIGHPGTLLALEAENERLQHHVESLQQRIESYKTDAETFLLRIEDLHHCIESHRTKAENLQHHIESHRTDKEMLSSSAIYFSTEYYAGLLTIRELRVRSKQDAEIMNNQEQQLCQLKKFVGLMIEIGLHEPVLKRAHESVLAGTDFEPVLVEAIRNAAARPGSAWSDILSAADSPLDDTPTTVPTDAPDMCEERRQSTVDDLLKNLQNGNIPFGRHRSASQRVLVNDSPARNRSTSKSSPLRVKPSRAFLSPGSPARCVLGKLDVNRSPPFRTGQLPDRSNKAGTPKTPKTRAAAGFSSTQAVEERPSDDAPQSDTPLSRQLALASLQHVLANLSSGSFGSLGTTTDGTQSADCDSSAEDTPHPAPVINPSPAAKSRVSLRPPTVCSTTARRASAPVASPSRISGRLTAKKSVELGSGFVSPGRPCRRPSDSGTPTVITGTGMQRKAGWR
ncbi:hypothetical protein DFH06DRAFT_428462 [Mycena polygramma]|nr:hypothetical protein DFH06DRAFT_428462 [Mycena polygramma]